MVGGGVKGVVSGGIVPPTAIPAGWTEKREGWW